MIENCIITPTFSGHFPCIEIYLRSFDEYVTDKQDIPIFFTIEAADKDEFDRIIAPYRNRMDLRVLYIDDLLIEQGIYLTPTNLLKKYGKYTYQTFKKLYTIQHVDAKKFLVLDSESSWIRKTSMKERFEKFFSHPRMYYSVMDNYYKMTEFKEPAYRNISYILGTDDRRWYLEQFMWYYEKRILMDLLDEYGSVLEIADKIRENANKELGIFEILLYCMFVGKNANKYGYQIFDMTALCKEYVPAEILANYIFEKDGALNKEGGLVEHVMLFITEENVRYFAKLFKKVGIDILRCDCGEASEAQRRFLDIVRPHILAASQNHEFGVNPLAFGRKEQEEKPCKGPSLEQQIQMLRGQAIEGRWREQMLARLSNLRHVFFGIHGNQAEKLRMQLSHIMRPGDFFIDEHDGQGSIMLMGIPVMKPKAVENLADKSIIIVLVEQYEPVRLWLLGLGYVENIDFIDGKRLYGQDTNVLLSAVPDVRDNTSGMIVYGLGAHLQDMLVWHPWLADRITCIIDKDPAKIGTHAVGVLVESPEALRSMTAGTEIVVSAIRYFDEIASEISAINPGLLCRNIDEVWQKYAREQGLNFIEKTQASVPTR